MRRTALVLLLLSTPVFAQSSADRWRASVFRASKGYGAALAYSPRAAWDVEAAVSEWSYDQPVTTFSNGGVIPVTVFHHETVHPMDFYVTRHLASIGRVEPFVHAGVHYVELADQRPETTFENGLPATSFRGTQRRGSAQAGGGVLVRLTPHLALRGEVTRLLRSEDSVFDPLTHAAGGLSWQF